MPELQLIGGKFKVIRRLGSGGHGTVYLCQSDVGKDVAVKVLESAKGDELLAKRFVAEARALAKFEHPGIVRILSFGITTDGAPYYSMDAIEGYSLASALERDGPLAPQRLLSLFMQAFDALAHAHERGIIHRDIKPSNIMLTKSPDGSERVILIDFGLARATNQAGKLTSTGDLMGTPCYMSPEQCLGGVINHSTDIYSLGCTMYEAATGKPPFVGDSYAVLNGHINTTPSGIPNYLAQFLQKCLCKNPADRFASAEEAHVELATIAQRKAFDTAVNPEPVRDMAPSLSAHKIPLRKILIILCTILAIPMCILALLTASNTSSLTTSVPAAVSSSQMDVAEKKFSEEIEKGHIAEAEELKNGFLSSSPPVKSLYANIDRLIQIEAAEHPELAIANCQILEKAVAGHMLYTKWSVRPLILRLRLTSKLPGVQNYSELLEAADRGIAICQLAKGEHDESDLHVCKARFLTKTGDIAGAQAEFELAIRRFIPSKDKDLVIPDDALLEYLGWLDNHDKTNSHRVEIIKTALEILGKQGIEERTANLHDALLRALNRSTPQQHRDYIYPLVSNMSTRTQNLPLRQMSRLCLISATLLRKANYPQESAKLSELVLAKSKAHEESPKLCGIDAANELMQSGISPARLLDLSKWCYGEISPFKATKQQPFIISLHYLGEAHIQNGRKVDGVTYLDRAVKQSKVLLQSAATPQTPRSAVSRFAAMDSIRAAEVAAEYEPLSLARIKESEELMKQYRGPLKLDLDTRLAALKKRYASQSSNGSR